MLISLSHFPSISFRKLKSLSLLCHSRKTLILFSCPNDICLQKLESRCGQTINCYKNNGVLIFSESPKILTMKLLISAILLAASTGAINVSVSQKQGRIVIVPSKESEILSDLFLTRHKLDLL